MYVYIYDDRYAERKEPIEVVDFDSLAFKLKDYNIEESLCELLIQLQEWPHV